jgi:hypothetical protein
MQLTVKRKQGNQWSAQLDDVKKQLGHQLENLAKVAAEMGQEAVSAAHDAAATTAKTTANVTQDVGTKAAGTAGDLGNQAARATSDLGSQAVSTVREIPVGAAALAAGAMKGLQQLGSEIRKVRVTREPAAAQRGPDARPGIALLAGFGGGLALMYFYDPNEGRRRRALLRDKLGKWTRISRQTAEGTAKDVRNRAVGVMHEAQKAVTSRSGMGEDMTELASGNGYGTHDAAEPEQSPFTEQPEHSQVGM